MIAYPDPFPILGGPYSDDSHACNCIGPQNGNPVCPCMMPSHTRSQLAEKALQILISQSGKPIVRVKAGRRVV